MKPMYRFNVAELHPSDEPIVILGFQPTTHTTQGQFIVEVSIEDAYTLYTKLAALLLKRTR